MNRSNAKPLPQYDSILDDLQSLHPSGNEITLKFSDADAMEAFKLAAVNALIHQQHSRTRQQCTPTPQGSIRRHNLENELYNQNVSRRATILCRTALFWQYLEEVVSTVLEEDIDEMRSKQYIYRLCGINSRRDLDFNQTAEERFHKMVEDPFLAWLSNH